LTGALDPAVDQLRAFLVAIPSMGWGGIAAGLAGVGVREIVNQAGKKVAGA
jgi:hypothetical protein